MINKDSNKKLVQEFGMRQKVAFALSSLPIWLIVTVFQVWVFTFYFSAVGLPIRYILMAFIIWSFWNVINNPMIGFLSDRTRTRWGRRKPYIMIGTIPAITIMIIVWIPPTENPLMGFVYLIIMLFAFDTFYTMIELPCDCLFPELYISVEERAEVNTLKLIFSVLGLLCAYLIPGLLIEDITVMGGYLISGIVMSIIMIITLLISLKWGIVEKEEFKHDSIHEFNFFSGLKHTLNSRGFVLYLIMFLGCEYIQIIQGMVIPLWCKYVLGVEGSFEASILLGISFIVAITTIILWKKVDIKIGSRFAYFIALCIYCVASIPFLFVSNYYMALIVFGFVGVGLGGLLYFNYLIIADIIDEDELQTGIRREGSFFGVVSLFLHFASVLSILTISIVFSSTGWEEFTPNPGADVILGLRLLMFLSPAITIGIMCITLYFYPFPKSRVMEIKEKLADLHRNKKERLAQEGY